jgi:TolA-binding protein
MSDTNNNSGLEFLENPEALAGELGKVEKTLQQNRNILYAIGGGLLAAMVLYFGYKWYVGDQDKQGQAALSSAVFAFEADSLNKALKGSGGNQGLLAIAEEYGSSPAGNLAHLYAGTALLKQGKFDDAIEHLKSFSSTDLLIQARAYALLGDAYLEKNDAEEAIGYYKKASDYKPNAFFTPGYMMKWALACEKAKQNEDAIEIYGDLIEKYPQSQEAANAKKFKGALESAAE